MKKTLAQGLAVSLLMYNGYTACEPDGNTGGCEWREFHIRRGSGGQKGSNKGLIEGKQG